MGLVAPWHVESSWIPIEPMSSALAGEFLTTGLPGKPCNKFFHGGSWGAESWVGLGEQPMGDVGS